MAGFTFLCLCKERVQKFSWSTFIFEHQWNSSLLLRSTWLVRLHSNVTFFLIFRIFSLFRSLYIICNTPLLLSNSYCIQNDGFKLKILAIFKKHCKKYMSHLCIRESTTDCPWTIYYAHCTFIKPCFHMQLSNTNITTQPVPHLHYTTAFSYHQSL